MLLFCSSSFALLVLLLAPSLAFQTQNARHSVLPRSALGNSEQQSPPEKAALLALIEDLESRGSNRGSSSRVEEGIRLQSLIETLASNNPNPECVKSDKQREYLVGVWKLVYTARSNIGLESKEWLQYLLENGPSPIQRFVIGSVQQVGRVYQTLELGDSGGSFNNFIDFRDSLGGVLNLQARVEGYTGGTQLDIRFANAYFEFIRNPITMVPFKEPKRVPYPVPFRLLPNESRGILDNIYVDADFRLARGNKGTIFVLRKEENIELPPAEPLV